MIDSLKNYLSIAVIIVLVIAVVSLWIYYNYIKPKHTRERFAFVAPLWLLGLIATLTALFFGQNQFFDWFIQAVNPYLSHPLPSYQPIDPVWSVFICCFTFLLFYFLIIKLHSGWNGEKSTRQKDQEETAGKASFWEDFRYYLRHKDDIEIAPKDKKQKREVFPGIEPDTRPWHIKAATLLNLYDQQYVFDLERDWHRSINAFIGRYDAGGKKLGVLCCHDNVSEKELQAYAAFVGAKTSEYHKHLVAISGNGKRRNETHAGITFEFCYESELLEELVNFTDYKRFINKAFDEEPLPGSELKLKDIYVPLGGKVNTIENEKLVAESEVENVEQFILNWIQAEQPQEHLVLLGDYGQGKTVLTYKLVKEMLQKAGEFTRIPILISLRGLSPRTDDDLDILGKWAKIFGVKSKALWELHQAGRLLLILDGFDEMDLVGDTELLFQHFNQIWALAKAPKSRIILTGRSNLFLNDIERRDALGIVPQRVDLPYTKALSLNTLTVEQIEYALRNVQAQTRMEILEGLEATGQDSSFAELLMRPSTLYQAATIWDAELAQHSGRLNSAIVIGKFIDKTYERQAAKGDNVLTTHERNFFMMGIAVGMMLKNQYKNQIREQDLKGLIALLWQHYPQNYPPYRDAQQGAGVKAFLPQRLKENQNALDSILRDVLAGGIIVQDLSGRDMFRFAHKSFMEYLVSYFYADFLLKKDLDKTRLMAVNHIEKALKFKQTQLAPSRDVERFVAEQVVGQIELSDKNGQPLPVKGNEILYRKAIFNKVNPYWIGRLFPNTVGWCLAHPMIMSLIYVSGLSLVLFIAKIYSLLSLIFIQINIAFICVYVVINIITLNVSLIKKNAKTKKSISVKSNIGEKEFPYSIYNGYMRLYQNCCYLLHQNALPIKNIYGKYLKIKEDTTWYFLTTFELLNVCIFALGYFLVFGISQLEISTTEGWRLLFFLPIAISLSTHFFLKGLVQRNILENFAGKLAPFLMLSTSIDRWLPILCYFNMAILSISLNHGKMVHLLLVICSLLIFGFLLRKLLNQFLRAINA